MANIGTLDANKEEEMLDLFRKWRENAKTHKWVRDRSNDPWPGSVSFTCRKCRLRQSSKEYDGPHYDGPQSSNISCDEYIVSSIMNE